MVEHLYAGALDDGMMLLLFEEAFLSYNVIWSQNIFATQRNFHLTFADNLSTQMGKSSREVQKGAAISDRTKHWPSTNCIDYTPISYRILLFQNIRKYSTSTVRVR